MNATPPVGTPNAATDIKLRTAAALIRAVQDLTPHLEEARQIVQEVTDVIDSYGTLTDEELENLGVKAATVTNLVTFLTKLVEFLDASTATKKSYRASINSVKRVGAYL